MVQSERSTDVQQNPQVLFVYKIIYVLLSVIWAAALLAGSLLPGGSALAAGVERFNLFGFGLHLVGYAIFGLILVLALKNYGVKNEFIWAILVAAGYGTAMEVLQMFVPNRDPSVVDAIANAVGAFITATIYQIKYGRRPKELAQR